MIKKIKSSLFAKIFLMTSLLLLCTSLFVFGLLAWWMPQTYSNRLNAILDKRAQDFVSELEQVTFSDSGGLFDQFTQDEEINYVALYDGNGDFVSLPTERAMQTEQFDGVCEEVSIAQTTYDDISENAPVLSNPYYFSFLDSSERYLLIVYGTAEQVAQLRESFVRIFPFIMAVVLAVAFAVSWLFSHMITKPVLTISRIAEKLSDLQFHWTVDEKRTDELGILAKSLNTLSHNLSTALSDLQNANRKLEADIAHEKELEQARTNFFSAVSHELKTPVTIMKGQLEGMLLGIGVYKDREKYLTRTLEIANTLETMVQEILTISRLETASTDFRKERLDCAEIIKSYLSETEDFIVAKDLQIHLDLSSSIFIEGNKMLIEKVFSNLIGNAIKYSPQGASISICAHPIGPDSIDLDSIGSGSIDSDTIGSHSIDSDSTGSHSIDPDSTGSHSIDPDSVDSDSTGSHSISSDLLPALAEHKQISFSIENTGAHIPKDSIPKLFDAFYRVEQSRNRKTGGSGLGLYIVQEILHRYGSECMVCNTQSGVEFSFTI